MNYYEHHLGDWAAATGHLTWDEDMAYTRLLRAYYHHERAIPEGQQYRLAKASTPAQRKAVDQVLAEFFTLIDGHHHQKRADAEIARCQDKQRKAKASADARWSHTGRNANASPNAMRTHSDGNALQTPVTRHQEEKETGAAKSQRSSRKCPDSFEPPDADAFCAAEAKGVDWRSETAKFRDHTFKTPLTDWLGAWRNWMRRAAEQRLPVATQAGRHSGFAAKNYREGVEADGSFT